MTNASLLVSALLQGRTVEINGMKYRVEEKDGRRVLCVLTTLGPIQSDLSINKILNLASWEVVL